MMLTTPSETRMSERLVIFVFGSNESGIHGSGAAYHANQKLGAEMGHGFGPTGTTFAIPTKDWEIKPLQKRVIKHYVDRFLAYAYDREFFDFKITRIGCGLAGYHDSDIAPMFVHAPVNCLFDKKWEEWLPTKKFWGTFAE